MRAVLDRYSSTARGDLRKRNGIQDHLVEINRLENVADKILRSALARQFKVLGKLYVRYIGYCASQSEEVALRCVSTRSVAIIVTFPPPCHRQASPERVLWLHHVARRGSRPSRERQLESDPVLDSPGE
jgi:hypothetical protein